MSSSQQKSKLKFLLDENAKRELLEFLNSVGFDVVWKPKGLSNGKLAEFSKLEKRVFVTNDKDFTSSKDFPKEKIFSVVLLRISQTKAQSLISSFSKLLDETKNIDFKGKLIILYEDNFVISELE